MSCSASGTPWRRSAAWVTVVVGLFAMFLPPRPLRAQDVIVEDGWEGVRMVEYQGGDAKYAKKAVGMLIFTDSTVAFYDCLAGCKKTQFGYFLESGLIWSLPIRTITEVTSKSQNKGPSIKGRVAFGVLATDNNEEYFGFSYETEKTAESPVFKVKKATSSAMEAKLRFRMKKLGMKAAVVDTVGASL